MFYANSFIQLSQFAITFFSFLSDILSSLFLQLFFFFIYILIKF